MLLPKCSGKFIRALQGLHLLLNLERCLMNKSRKRKRNKKDRGRVERTAEILRWANANNGLDYMVKDGVVKRGVKELPSQEVEGFKTYFKEKKK